MPRYVILHHELPPNHSRSSHWDLMLERGDALRTWALAAEPLAADSIEAQQLDDHRLAYLDYEGPISGDRGSVSLWDAGDYRLEHDSGNELIVTLRGGRLIGQLTLKPLSIGGHSWTVSFAADPTRG